MVRKIIIIVIVLGFGAAIALTSLTSEDDTAAPEARESQNKTSELPEDKIIDEAAAPGFEIPGSDHYFALPGHAFQTFNNCGPATLSMIFAYHGVNKTQVELRDLMRPYNNSAGDNDDKSVFSGEFVRWAKTFDLEGMVRPAGDLNLVKTLVANNIPVVVRTWLHPGEDIGHYRVIHGFDDVKKEVIQTDSFIGKDLRISYAELLAIWQPFNYEYFVIHPREQTDLMAAILGEDFDEKLAWNKAERVAREESAANPGNLYPGFNLAAALYHLGRYEESVAEFEKIEEGLPSRMLWYQLEPILAYEKIGRYDKVFATINDILSKDNRAFSELYQIRGEIYVKQEKPEQARTEFQLALRYNKNFQPAEIALKQLDTP